MSARRAPAPVRAFVRFVVGLTVLGAFVTGLVYAPVAVAFILAAALLVFAWRTPPTANP